MKQPTDPDPIDRGSAEDQERWLAELSAAAEAENFPPGSLILAESCAHAREVADELRAAGHRAIVRGVYVRTTCVLQEREEPPPTVLPPCMKCQRPFGEHEELPSGDRACLSGGGTFDCEFQISDEVAEFVRANLDKTPEELTQLWIDRVRKKARP